MHISRRLKALILIAIAIYLVAHLLRVAMVMSKLSLLRAARPALRPGNHAGGECCTSDKTS